VSCCDESRGGIHHREGGQFRLCAVKGQLVSTDLDIRKVFRDLANEAGPDFGRLRCHSRNPESVERVWVLRGVRPARGSAHRHADAEDFFVLSGTQQVLVQEESGLVWRDAHARDYVRVPGDVPHAHRNVTAEAAIDLIVTTARLGQFFEEIGRPVTDSLAPPTPDELAHFLETSAEYGYLLGTPEVNAAVGIEMPTFSG
jgi:quercetin dioxygenase-like cupin family protein